MKYFFDTNIISNLVKKDDSTISLIKNIINDDSEFFINKLVYIESLRAIPMTHKKLFKATKETLDNFIKLDINKEIYDESIIFARFCKNKGINLGKCEVIDYLHFITAKYYNLKIISYDKDLERLEDMYKIFK